MARRVLALLVMAIATAFAPRAIGFSPLREQPPRSALEDRTLIDFTMAFLLGGWYSSVVDYGDDSSGWLPVDFDDSFQDQELESILDEIDPVLVIASNRADPDERVSGLRLLSSIVRSPIAVVHASGQEPKPTLRMLVTSLGVSTGDAFRVQFVNQGFGPVALPRGGVTLRPLKKAAAARALSEFSALSGRVTTMNLFGYCLNYQKHAPRAGMVYVLAPRAVQERNLAVRELLRAATALNAAGLIKPEGDPREYLHSIRQWAVWTREQNFTERTFTRAMLDRAKKNLSGNQRQWTTDDDRFVRASAARRWADVSRVLALADKLAAARKAH